VCVTSLLLGIMTILGVDVVFREALLRSLRLSEHREKRSARHLFLLLPPYANRSDQKNHTLLFTSLPSGPPRPNARTPPELLFLPF